MLKMAQKSPKMAQNGTFWSQVGLKRSKTTICPHFLGQENHFWYIWVDFRDQNMIFGDNLCWKWPKIAQNGTFWSQTMIPVVVFYFLCSDKSFQQHHRWHNSAESIHIKIGNFVYFDEKNDLQNLTILISSILRHIYIKKGGTVLQKVQYCMQ